MVSWDITQTVIRLHADLHNTVRMALREIFSSIVKNILYSRTAELQGGSNMTGTDLYVNKPHCAAAVRP